MTDATQPPRDLSPADTVWASEWNPGSDRWDPNSEPVGGYHDEAMYGDVGTADPMSESYGGPPSGTVPEAGLNLLTDVDVAAPSMLPPIEHHHVVETIELGSDAVRARTVRVVANNIETELLPQDDRRSRALIKVVTSASAILIGAARSGGNPAFNATPTGPAVFWYHATGDGVLEVKATAAVSAFGTSAAGAVDVSVWEELSVKDNTPGLAV